VGYNQESKSKTYRVEEGSKIITKRTGEKTPPYHIIIKMLRL
jgi:hypothetical protein